MSEKRRKELMKATSERKLLKRQAFFQQLERIGRSATQSAPEDRQPQPTRP